MGSELRLDTCTKGRKADAWNSVQVDRTDDLVLCTDESSQEKLMQTLFQVFTLGWREDIRPGDPLHTKKVCFDAISHTSPVTLFDCHGMRGNQLWKYRKVSRLQISIIGGMDGWTAGGH